MIFPSGVLHGFISGGRGEWLAASLMCFACSGFLIPTHVGAGCQYPRDQEISRPPMESHQKKKSNALCVLDLEILQMRIILINCHACLSK